MSTLISHWRMNDNTGTTAVVDDVGPNSGVSARNTNLLTVAGFGNITSGLQFNGSGDYVNLGSNASLNAWYTNYATLAPALSFWIYPTNHQCLLFYFGANLGNIQPSTSWYVYLSTANILRYGGIYNNSGESGTTSISLNTLTHVAFLRSPTSFYIYINGSQVYSGAATTPTNVSTGTGYVTYSTTESGLGSFSGKLYDCRLYSNLLATDITRLYNAGLGTEADYMPSSILRNLASGGNLANAGIYSGGKL
jgi:hypothetical protein